LPAAAGRRDDLTILDGRRVRFGHIQRKTILNFAFVAACGPLQTHFHGRGRDGKQLPFIFTTSLVKGCSRNARRRFWNTNIKIQFR
jgi:hypothetical protein